MTNGPNCKTDEEREPEVSPKEEMFEYEEEECLT